MLPRDKVMMGMLATLGIERGKPNQPAGQALVTRWSEASGTPISTCSNLDEKLFAREPSAGLTTSGAEMVPDDKVWFEFVTDDAVQIDGCGRGLVLLQSASGCADRGCGNERISPQPLIRSERLLEPGRNHRLHVPADVPARQFWSLISVGDNATWSFVINPQKRNGLVP